MKQDNLSRRSFIKQCVVSGIAVYSAPLLVSSDDITSSLFEEELQKSWKSHDQPNFRFDAIAKITGEKIYGSDYRAKDIKSWPNAQTYAYIVRVNKADHIYEGLDLSHLQKNEKPNKIITAKDLIKDKIDLPGFYGNDMLLSEGHTPLYLGHEVAILLFDDFLSFKLAKNKIQFNDNIIKYGKKVPLACTSQDPYATWRSIRQESSQDGYDEDLYSTMKDGFIFPKYKNHKPVWTKKLDQNGNAHERGMFYADKLDKDFEKEDWLKVEHTYTTQSIDTHALETESFNGWFDKKNDTLHCVISSQSPGDFYVFAGQMIAKSLLHKQVKKIIVHSPYIGGGFGGKDHTPYPYYGMIASIYSDKPVLVANDRYQQFQSGIKRHPFVMRNRLAFDKKTKKIKGLICDMDLDGGGRANFSSSVTMVGVGAAKGIYYVPRNDINATCYTSELPPAGSMRGYGSLQTMSAMEMMMNEASEHLGICPMELRKINVSKPGQKNSQGAVPTRKNRYAEMIDLAKNNAIWINKEKRKKEFEKNNSGLSYGVGFGIVTKNYGTGSNAPSSRIEIDAKGKITLRIISMEMGTGIDTTQASLVSKYLGNMADEIILADRDALSVLKLKETDNPYSTSQERQDKMSKDPRWTPVIDMASSASASSYFQTHTTEIAAKLLLKYGLFPAAVEIWRIKHSSTKVSSLSYEDALWIDGKLSVSGLPSLKLSQLAKKANEMGLVTGVSVHSFNRWAWVSAEFMVDGKKETLELDALALRYGNSKKYNLLDRLKVDFPKTSLGNAMATYYAPCATLVEISVNEDNGEVKILQTHTFLEAGRILVRKLVEGQIEGGIAMGVGHALYEEIPEDDTGAGNGSWNLDKYHLPRAKEVGVWNMAYTFLDPFSDNAPTKGMAEVVIVPVVSAIVEAIYQATSKRFYHLPIKKEDLMRSV